MIGDKLPPLRDQNRQARRFSGALASRRLARRASRRRGYRKWVESCRAGAGGFRSADVSPTGRGRLAPEPARLPTFAVNTAAGRTPGQPARRQRSDRKRLSSGISQSLLRGAESLLPRVESLLPRAESLLPRAETLLRRARRLIRRTNVLILRINKLAQETRGTVLENGQLVLR